jgi:hypothetical protein
MQSRIKTTSFLLSVIFYLTFIGFVSPKAEAQMFGERSVGAAGTLQGNERFLRGNRSRRDFVGADRGELSGFVGAQQAIGTGRVRSATEGLRIDAVNPRRINRPLTPIPSRGLYYPRLELDLPPAAEVNSDLPYRISKSNTLLSQRIERVGGPDVEVLISGSTATLRGTAESQKAAELLSQILLFEPGIENVVSELQVRRKF